jgi:hypothetical protein
MLSAIGDQFRLTPEEQEDATQSTWLQLFRYIEQIRNLDCVGGWLAATMRRQCISASRRRYVENPMSDLPESSADPAASDLVDAVAHRQAMKRLHEAVDRLPDRERELHRGHLCGRGGPRTPVGRNERERHPRPIPLDTADRFSNRTALCILASCCREISRHGASVMIMPGRVRLATSGSCAGRGPNDVSPRAPSARTG